MIDDPPSETGTVQLTVACPLPADAVTLVGASGLPGATGVTATDAVDDALVPAELVAVTLKL